ncbi:MAG: acyl-CoA dehydrogenase family protein [Candidatus Nanopelagicales bacterium]|nr:acyl-CoA dehydrogenase family protein [Candidatus Nanopelagicales bacterium]
MSALDWDRTETRVALRESLADMQARAGSGLLEHLIDAEIPWIGISTHDGGAGGDLGDAAIAVRTLATMELDAPIAETGLVCGWALASCGLQLERQLMAPAFELGTSLTGIAVDGVVRVSGHVDEVPGALAAQAIITTVEIDGVLQLCAVAIADAAVTSTVNLADESRCSLTYVSAPVVASAPLAAGLTRFDLLARLALARAIQSCGALTELRDLTIGYARTREQFGRPLSDLQVIAQMLAELAELTLSAQAAVAAAIERPGTWQSAIAKSVTGRAARRAAALAHQVHGAMGMSQEYPLGRLTTRLWSWTEEAGRPELWEAWIGEQFLLQSSPVLWDTVVNGVRGESA